MRRRDRVVKIVHYHDPRCDHAMHSNMGCNCGTANNVRKVFTGPHPKLEGFVKYFCTHRDKNGYWMEAMQGPPYSTNVSDSAIGRTFKKAKEKDE
jgi:hypothetical protein